MSDYQNDSSYIWLVKRELKIAESECLECCGNHVLPVAFACSIAFLLVLYSDRAATLMPLLVCLCVAQLTVAGWFKGVGCVCVLCV